MYRNIYNVKKAIAFNIINLAMCIACHIRVSYTYKIHYRTLTAEGRRPFKWH